MANNNFKITVKRQYISYGLAFNPEDFNEVKNCKSDAIRNKPCYCGLWASPIDAQYGWLNFCKSEGVPCYMQKWTRFVLKPSARIRKIDSYEDYKRFMTSYKDVTDLESNHFDWEKIAKDYDAVEVTYNAVLECRVKDAEQYNLYMEGKAPHQKQEEYLESWSCDSIVILHKDVIQVLETKDN
jgi:hypothetical protein